MQRNKMQKMYRKNKSEMNKKAFYTMVNLVREEINKFKCSTWKKMLNRSSMYPTSSKPFWARINRVRNGKMNNGITKIKCNNEVINDKGKIAKAFADKLSKTFNHNDIDEVDYDSTHKSTVDSYISKKEYLNNIFSNKSISKITTREVLKAIKKTNNKKTIDQFGLSNLILKKLPNTTIVAINNLFNKCLLNNELIHKWKVATITMIPKKSKSIDINNYRPISSTPVLIKLFERIIADRLNDFLHKNNIIIKQQSGFRQHRSTKDNLIFLCQKVLESFERKKKVC
jgi:hypothetical protein